jgi:predicted alpha/beta superfamily hydrolase
MTTTLHQKLIRLLSGVAVLLLISSAAIAQPATGTLKKFSIKSTVLGEDRIILVRTPAGYETNQVSYPVLYMTDGDAHMGHTASTIEFLVQNGRISDLIVVGVTNTDRTRDLSPVKSSDKNAAGETAISDSGGADNF